MIGVNGTKLAAANAAGNSTAAHGFFDLLYQWSRIGCSGSQRLPVTKPVHSKYPRKTTPRACHPRLSSATIARSSLTQIRHNSSKSQIIPILSNNELPLSKELRYLMRSIPHAVVVLTTTTKTSKPPYSVYRGMTLSSFTTLTLTPSPIVTFNIRQPSRTLNAIKKSKHFLIHILSATASGARVADAFTKGNDADVFARDDCFRVQKEVLKENGSSYPGLELPRLEADGVLKVLRCEVLDAGLSKDRISGLVQVGDHVLLLAKVHEILEATKSSNEDEAKEASNGLFYADGRYRKVGDVIEHEEKVSGDETSA